VHEGDENLRPHVDCSSQQGRECGKRILDTQPTNGQTRASSEKSPAEWCSHVL
jgi:hypothetical protein